jgi:hypothetical protein
MASATPNSNKKTTINTSGNKMTCLISKVFYGRSGIYFLHKGFCHLNAGINVLESQSPLRLIILPIFCFRFLL